MLFKLLYQLYPYMLCILESEEGNTEKKGEREGEKKREEGEKEWKREREYFTKD